MDVLEHVEDDAGLLRTYLDKAPPQAQAVITVPAFQFLWSHHDVFLEHHRRYTLKTLSRVVERAGAVPLRMHRSDERRDGKEGVVRVVLGGRRIIKKKKPRK